MGGCPATKEQVQAGPMGGRARKKDANYDRTKKKLS